MREQRKTIRRTVKKKEDVKTRISGLGNNAQKMLVDVPGNVSKMANNILHKAPPKSPLENHEILLKKEMEFHQAAKDGDVPKMEALKMEKVNINAKNALDRTALHFAVACQKVQSITFLLNHKARIDIVDKHGLTVLHLAACYCDLYIVQMLVKVGVSQKATNEDGMNVLHFAAQNNKNDIVDYLLKDLQLKDLNIKDARGREPFHLAAERGHIDMIKNLLDMGLFTSEPDKDYNTALHLASANGHTKVVEVLLGKWDKEEKDAINNDGASPFYLAVEGGHEDCAALFLQHQCDINTMTHNGYTALHIAAEKGYLSLVNFLIRNNIDLTPKPNDKNPPFHLAILHYHTKIVNEQKEKVNDQTGKVNENTEKVNDNTEKVNDNTEKVNDNTEKVNDNTEKVNDHTEKVNDHTEKVNGQKEIVSDHMKIVDALFDAGYDINALNARMQTPLHLASELKNTELVEKLLTAGRELNIADKQGKTPLGVAARSNHTLIVDMIIKAERYHAWRKELCEASAREIEDNATITDYSISEGNSILDTHSHVEDQVTFKQDHSSQTRQIRAALWSLAYQQLKPGEWKKLAKLWNFTEPQIRAIETQWTDKASYKEHCHRMLLIWLHGILLKKENPIKSLYEDLVEIGHQQLAETFRVQSMTGVEAAKKCIIS